MSGVPAILSFSNRNVVIVGGGSVALRRAKTFQAAGANVTVIAPEIDTQLEDIENIQIHQRDYETGDLNNAMMVVIATDQTEINDMVASDAEVQGILINRADQPDAGNVVIPAHVTRGPLTVSVYTDGISARAGAEIRDYMMAHLDEDWLILLRVARTYRKKFQEEISDPLQRQILLRKLASDQAMEQVRAGGELQLQYWYEEQLREFQEKDD